MRSRAELVEARVADVAERHRAVVYQRHCEHAGHAVPLGARRRGTIDFVVGVGDGGAQAIGGRTRVPAKCFLDQRQGDVGGPAARGLPADAIDDAEDAAVRVEAQNDPR
jgi:hypothetical protein